MSPSLQLRFSVLRDSLLWTSILVDGLLVLEVMDGVVSFGLIVLSALVSFLGE